MNRAWRIGIWSSGLVLTLATVGPTQQPRENWADYLPPGEGKALVERRCTGCHDLWGALRYRQSRAAWEATVYDMVARGAPIFLEEADQIVSYLGEAFGPNAPPLTDVNSASREDLMKLPGMGADLADKLIAYRNANGPLGSREQVREVLSLDPPAFEKIKYYLRPSARPVSR